MIIQNMFEEDINRPINGVIKVDQDELGVIEQEVKEYVITKELKKHFISFFNYYSDSFDRPTSDRRIQWHLLFHIIQRRLQSSELFISTKIQENSSSRELIRD